MILYFIFQHHKNAIKTHMHDQQGVEDDGVPSPDKATCHLHFLPLISFCVSCDEGICVSCDDHDESNNCQIVGIEHAMKYIRKTAEMIKEEIG
jgi:hypothetical protein